MAETLFAAGTLDSAEHAFEALRSRFPGDTTIALRLASLRLLRNDRAGARAVLQPLLAEGSRSRSARSLAAESYARDLDFVHAAPLERELGREAKARQMESFAHDEPYRYQGPERVVVPFVQTDPLPLIEVRLNGKGPYLFLIDTGGADIVVDPVLVDSLGLPNFGEEEGTFAGGRKRAVIRSRVDSLGLGLATFHGVPAGLLDCSRFSALAAGRRIFGILGTLVLMRRRATLDYPGGALVLEPRTPAIDSPGVSAAATDSNRIVMPMWLGGDHYVLARGRLGDGPDALWFVDTGLAGAAMTAPASALRDAGMAVPDTSSGGSGIGGGGSMKIQPFAVAKFSLGGAHAAGLLGFFGAFPPSLERAFGYRIAGIISHAFFRPWQVTFDFDRMHLILTKRG